jgi:hypothetical protein
MDDGSPWLERYERAGLVERAGMLVGGAVRLTANAIETVIDRAAQIATDAEKAFRRESDPNIIDARVLEEWVVGQPEETKDDDV